MEKRMNLRRTAVLTVPVSEAEMLLKEASASAALLYLYILNTNGGLDESAAAVSLRMTREEIHAAAKILVRLGILEGGSSSAEPAAEETKPRPPAPELAEVDAAQIALRTKDAPEWKDLLNYAEDIYGRKLATAEIKTLFGVYDQIGLPVDVIMLMLQYCTEQTEKRSGAGRRPSFRTVEKEAFRWADRELMSYERAEEWLAEEEKRRGRVGEVMQALQLYGREPTTAERGYIEGWLGLGFTVEALTEAWERTVTNTGSLKWKYMDGIVRSWDSKGLHTLAEIRSGDKKSASHSAPETAQGPTAAEFERMKKLREKVRNG